MIETVGGQLVGPGLLFGKPCDDNWAALAIAIICNKSIDKSLNTMGIKPRLVMPRRTDGKRHVIGEAAYMLVAICGQTKAEAAALLHVSPQTVSVSIKILKGEPI